MVGIHNEAFGADKGEEDCAYDGFGEGDDEESEDVEDDHAEEAGLRRALPKPGEGEGKAREASNKYTFRKISQVGFRKSCFRKVSRVRNTCIFASFRKHAFAEMLRFGKFSQI